LNHVLHCGQGLTGVVNRQNAPFLSKSLPAELKIAQNALHIKFTLRRRTPLFFLASTLSLTPPFPQFLELFARVMSSSSIPTLRWGIIGAGMISSWFAADLVLSRKDAKAEHIVQAIGSSSLEKGKAFITKHIPNSSPTVYDSYEEVYSDSKVDIVYIGTPHVFHKKNCLDAIAAGKNVLCEKPFAITAKETKEVLAAAKAKGVFIMEAMWTRFNPVALTLQKKLYEERVIGDVRRTFCDFGLEMNIAALSSDSRLKNPELGAGSLLDIGIYSLTWGLLTLSSSLGEQAETPQIAAVQSLSEEIDMASSILLHYSSTGRQGILTSTTEIKTEPVFCRIEGTNGYITVEGGVASAPSSFTVYPKNTGSATGDVSKVSGGGGGPRGADVYKFENDGFGFFWEADAVAMDIAAARKENAIMPHAETLRVMEMLDEIRRQGGARFPQDDQ
jgi:predicted dehydrogenase